MKRILIAGLLSAASGVLFAVGRRQAKARNLPASPAPSSMSTKALAPVALAERRYMLGVVVPVWIGAGLADYIWHRRTKIETTSGTHESVMHMLMLMEGAPIVLGGLLLEINAGVLALMMAAYFAHEATAMYDVGYTVVRRKVPPGEQHTHSFLELLPFSVLGFYITMYWEQFLALFGRGREAPRFDIRLKQTPLPPRYLFPMVSAITLLDALPHAEELWRCWQAERQGLTGRDTPECAPELFGHALVGN